MQVLRAVFEALQQGANVIGYSFWTLNYDYEWNDGYTQDMGLFDVQGYFGDDGGPLSNDSTWAPGPTTSFTRVPLHPIVDVYQSIAGSNAISTTLLDQYATDGGEWYEGWIKSDPLLANTSPLRLPAARDGGGRASAKRRTHASSDVRASSRYRGSRRRLRNGPCARGLFE